VRENPRSGYGPARYEKLRRSSHEKESTQTLALLLFTIATEPTISGFDLVRYVLPHQQPKQSNAALSGRGAATYQET
jgi:hypothetical protein